MILKKTILFLGIFSFWLIADSYAKGGGGRSSSSSSRSSSSRSGSSKSIVSTATKTASAPSQTHHIIHSYPSSKPESNGFFSSFLGSTAGSYMGNKLANNNNTNSSCVPSSRESYPSSVSRTSEQNKDKNTRIQEEKSPIIISFRSSNNMLFGTILGLAFAGLIGQVFARAWMATPLMKNTVNKSIQLAMVNGIRSCRP